MGRAFASSKPLSIAQKRSCVSGLSLARSFKKISDNFYLLGGYTRHCNYYVVTGIAHESELGVPHGIGPMPLQEARNIIESQKMLYDYTSQRGVLIGQVFTPKKVKGSNSQKYREREKSIQHRIIIEVCSREEDINYARKMRKRGQKIEDVAIANADMKSRKQKRLEAARRKDPNFAVMQAYCRA
jgi:hypothetical protein